MNWTTTVFPQGWQHYVLGGLVIGVGVGLMFALQGRRVGMSSVFSSSWSFVSKRAFFQQAALRQARGWRLVCALGLVLGGALWWGALGPAEGMHTQVGAARLLLGGVLVGFGARLSNGCTSGHGICGLASLSRPSLAAVLIFMATAMLSARLLAALASTGGAL